MEIRIVENTEIARALFMAGEIGMEYAQEQILQMAAKRQVLLAGCYEGSELRGCAMADYRGRILMVYVAEAHRGHKMGAALIDMLCQACSQRYSVLRITVEADPAMTGFFQRCGFTAYAGWQVQEEAAYVPMERMIPPSQVKPLGKKNYLALGLIIGAIAVSIILLAVCGVFLGKRVVAEIQADRARKATEEALPSEDADSRSDGNAEDEEGYGNESSDGRKKEATLDDVELEDIEAYVAENLPYEVAEETYEEEKKEGKSNINFHISYPQVHGLPSGKDAEVNQILRDAAMANADRFYLAPDEDIKAYAKEQQEAYLASEVKYKITYMDSGLLSVAYDDHYFAGNYAAEYSALRTRVINLETAKEFQVEDVVDGNDAFVKSLRGKLLAQAPDNYPANELSDEYFKRMMDGEIVDGRYLTNFLLEKDGLGIGFTFAFRSEDDDRLSRGWILSEYSRSEIRPYMTENELWNLIESDN